MCFLGFIHSFLCFVLLHLLFHGCVTIVEKKRIGQRKIKIKTGLIRGVTVNFPTTPKLQHVEAFFGVDYGSLKRNVLFTFHPPSDPIPNKRSEVNDCTISKGVCPQPRVDISQYYGKLPTDIVKEYVKLAKEQEDDCLSLNVYSPIPDWNNTSKLPVMVFVHGESYEIGTGNGYEGSVLASYGEVIVVTVNYRLGVLGFMSTGDQEASGNYALWDLFAVLTWINENIGAFGGDKDRVTLFGHGYGAALVNILLLSPVVSSTGTRLFQRAILQSGSALSPWAISFDAVTCTQWLAVNVNCSQHLDDSKKLVECFRRKTATELVENVPLSPKYFSCFAPTPGNDQMFPKSISELLKKKDTLFSQIPVMFGVTRNEAYSYLKQQDIIEGISKEKKAKLIRTFVHNLFENNREKLYDILDFQYTEWNKEQNRNTTRDNIMDMLSDGLYVAPVVEMAQEHAKTGADTYFYNFGYSTQSDNFPEWSSGVHGDELPYVFGAPLVDGISPFPSLYTQTEKKLSATVMRFWTNFAKSGNPNYPISDTDQDKFADLHWPTYDMEKQRHLHIDNRPNVQHHYRGSQLALWLDLIPKINTNADITAKDAHLHLSKSNNLSSFDDPTRLISNFRRIFPSPSSNPYLTAENKKQNDVYVTNHPPFVKTSTTVSSSTTRQNSDDKETEINTNPTTEPTVVVPAKQGSFATSSVPLSITVAIGCSLLFINILIFAGIYYQRKKIQKIKKEEEAEAANSNKHEEGEITFVPVNHISQSLTNSKPDIRNNHNKSVIEKQQDTPENYLYTAVPTHTNSPIHRTKLSHSQTNTFAGSARSEHLTNCMFGKPPISC